MKSHRTWISLLLAAVAAAGVGGACGDDDGNGGGGAFDAVPIGETLTGGGLAGPVDIVRDHFGVPHVRATTADDAAYASGWIVAHDRVLEMNLLRHLASGTIAELFGA